MKKVYICSMGGSGKGLLRSLLDGHQKIFTCPIQGFADSLINDKFIEFVKRKRLRILRERYWLSMPSIKCFYFIDDSEQIKITIAEFLNYLFATRSNFDQLIDKSLAGKTSTGPPGNMVFVDFDFNYNTYLEELVNKILGIGVFSSVEQLQDAVYEVFIKVWANKNKNYTPDTYFVQTARNGLRVIRNVLERNTSAIIFAMFRDPVSIAFTEAMNLRNMLSGSTGTDSISDKLIKISHKELFSTRYLYNLKYFRNEVNKIKEKNRNIYVVDFESLVHNTKEVMDGVADFLGIERDKVLYKPTLNSVELENNNAKLIDKIHDDPYKVLSKDQIDLIKYFIDGPSSKNSFLRNIYLAIMTNYHTLPNTVKTIKNKLRLYNIKV